MKERQTTISLSEIRKFFEEECKKIGQNFSDDNLNKFIDCCERDFYQWLKDNCNYFMANDN